MEKRLQKKMKELNWLKKGYFKGLPQHAAKPVQADWAVQMNEGRVPRHM